MAVDSSEDQFQELIAQLIVRVDKVLSGGNIFFPIGLLLNRSGEVETVITVNELSNQTSTHVNVIQQELIKKIQTGKVLATCVAYPDYRKSVVVALLENNQNYCSKVVIPVIAKEKIRLDMEDIEIENSGIYIFPVVQ